MTGKRTGVFVAIVSASLGLGSCGRDSKNKPVVVAPQSPPPAEEPPGLPLTVEPTKDSIQRDFIDKTCLSCHQVASQRNRRIELKDISTIAEEGHVHDPNGPRRDLVKPGCPTQSLLLSIIKEGKMPPPPADRPTEQSLKAIEAWIFSLKPNASCESDEPGNGGGGDDEPGT